MPHLPAGRTVWHITFGTYGARLHGGIAPTVDLQHNQPGEPVLGRDDQRHHDEQDRMTGDAVYLNAPQRAVIEAAIPKLCEEGGWNLHQCAAPPEPENNHVHVLLDADPSAPGKVIRELIKRWLTQELDKHRPRPAGGKWWAKGGSTKPVTNETYLGRVTPYIRNQRTTPP